MEFKVDDEVFFIKRYLPRYPYRPFDTFKVCKGILKEVNTNVKVIAADRKTVLYTTTHYIIKGLPNNIYGPSSVFETEVEALQSFKERKLKEYYKY